MKTLLPMENRFTATVVRATGSWYDVLHDGVTLRCRIRGKLRLKGVRSTNPWSWATKWYASPRAATA